MAKRNRSSKPSLLRQIWALVMAALVFKPERPRPPENPDVRFEPSDVNARGVVLTGLGILLVTWISAALLYFLFQYLSNIHKQMISVQAAATREVQLPPEPRLQRSPQRDLHDYMTQQKSELNRYAWVDRQKGHGNHPDRPRDGSDCATRYSAAEGAAEAVLHATGGLTPYGL